MEEVKGTVSRLARMVVVFALLWVTHYTAYYWGVYSHPSEEQVREAVADLYAGKPIRMTDDARQGFDRNLQAMGPISNIERMDVGWKWYGDRLTVYLVGSRRGKQVEEVITFDAMGSVIGFTVLQ